MLFILYQFHLLILYFYMNFLNYIVCVILSSAEQRYCISRVYASEHCSRRVLSKA